MTQQQTKNFQINFNPHPAQKTIWNTVTQTQKRFTVVDAGRRFGKTLLAVFLDLWFSGKPGAKIWWLSPHWAETLVGWRTFLENIPRGLIRESNRQEHTITMINGSQTWFKSADEYQALRAEGLDFIILDEAARIKQAAWQEAIRPALGDRDRIGKALFISTPSGLNWFYQIYLLGKVLDSEWISFKYPSWEKPRELWRINSKGQTDWEAAKQELPERIFRQEYGAEFLEDIATIFRFVDKAIKGSLESPNSTKTYKAGADLGKHTTWTVITIIDDDGHVVAWDRFKQSSWPLQVERIVNLVKPYDAELLIDSTGLGEPIYDYIQQKYPKARALPISSGSKTQSKKMVIDNLAVQIENAARDQPGITYPEELETLIDELKVFGVESNTEGQPRYEAPKGFYDDSVISLALAAWLLKRKRRPLSFNFVDW